MTSLRKVDSPFAKINSYGDVTCKLCKCLVKSTKVWTAHVCGRQHKENLLKLKGQGSSVADAVVDATDSPATELQCPRQKKAKLSDMAASPLQKPSQEHQAVPVDFFDTFSTPTVSTSEMAENEIEHAAAAKTQDANTEQLDSATKIPEKFFDDPILDNKARNISTQDILDKEWALFQKEIQQEQTTAEIMADEQDDEFSLERNLEEVDEEIRGWSRVNEFEKKVEFLKNIKSEEDDDNGFSDQLMTPKPQHLEDGSDESEKSVTIEEILDWRSKKY